MALPACHKIAASFIIHHHHHHYPFISFTHKAASVRERQNIDILRLNGN